MMGILEDELYHVENIKIHITEEHRYIIAEYNCNKMYINVIHNCI